MAGRALLVVGLGNPGLQYRATRHNVGFALVDLLAVRLGVALAGRPWWRYRFRSVRSNAVHLAQPLTFMNRSGQVMARLMDRAGVPLNRTLVVTDNMDLPVGAARMRLSGGPSRHNGLRSIETELGTTEFARIYVGVGRPSDTDVIAHVLGAFPADQAAVIQRTLESLADRLLASAGEDLASLVGQINAKPPE